MDDLRDGGGARAQACVRAEAERWAARAPHVPQDWFAHRSFMHGAAHTRRVHVHVQRLAGELGRGEDETRLTLLAALWHDIGRVDDGVDDGHGAASADRAVHLGLAVDLAPAEAHDVLFVVRFHSLPDRRAQAAAGDVRDGRERALRMLWLLKDADALDRVRLGSREAADPRQLRSDAARRLLEDGFEAALFAVLR